MDKAMPLVFGAVLGVSARYLVATRIHMMAGTGFPFETLAVNVSGCLLVGVFDSWAGTRGLIGPAGRLFLMTGFCATYTTFSTLILESAHLVSNGQIARALANYLGSGVLGFMSFRLGAFLGKMF